MIVLWLILSLAWMFLAFYAVEKGDTGLMRHALQMSFLCLILGQLNGIQRDLKK